MVRSEIWGGSLAFARATREVVLQGGVRCLRMRLEIAIGIE